MVFIKKKGSTDFAVGLLQLARSQDNLEGENRSSPSFVPPPHHRIGRFRNLLGWVAQGWVEVSASSQNTQALFSFANHNQMCPDLF